MISLHAEPGIRRWDHGSVFGAFQPLPAGQPLCFYSQNGAMTCFSVSIATSTGARLWCRQPPARGRVAPSIRRRLLLL